MSKLITFNDVEVLYNKDIIHHPISKEFICPVCGKSAVKKSTIEKHLQERNCAKMSSFLENSIYEETALKFLNSYTKSSFRKSLIYNSVMRFILFSYDIETPPELLYKFVSEKTKSDAIIKNVTDACYVNKKEYRRWLQQNTNLINSKDFYYKFKDRLRSDEDFLFNSIVKGKISIEYLCSVDEELINNLSSGREILLQEFLFGTA